METPGSPGFYGVKNVKDDIQAKPTELTTLKAENVKLREALKSTRPYTRPPVRSKLVFNAASDPKETDNK